MTTQPTTVTVLDRGVALVEPFLGAGRYPDDSIIVVTERTSPIAPGTTIAWAYRSTLTPHGVQWLPIWNLPERLREYLTGQPVGTAGKVSNRRVEVVDLGAAVPTGTIDIATGPNVDTWTSW